MKKIGLVILIIMVGIFVYFAISTILFFTTARDIENAMLRGHVYDESKLPANNCRVVIFNSTYKQKGSDYTDYSSYLGNEVIETKTNNKGYYELKMERSAQVLIRVYKRGYKVAESEGLLSEPHMEQSFFLQRGSSKESDLFEKPKITEIVE